MNESAGLFQGGAVRKMETLSDREASETSNAPHPPSLSFIIPRSPDLGAAAIVKKEGCRSMPDRPAEKRTGGSGGRLRLPGRLNGDRPAKGGILQKEPENLPAQIRILPGRVHKSRIEPSGPFLAQPPKFGPGVAAPDVESRRMAHPLSFIPDAAAGARIFFNGHHPGRIPAQRLEGDNARSRANIKEAQSFKALPPDVEEGLPHPISRRPHPLSHRSAQPPPAGAAADNPKAHPTAHALILP